MSKELINKLRELVNPIVEEKGLELYHIEMVKEGGEDYLRIYIDSEKGVDIDNCVDVSKAVSDVLDVEDPIENPYYLEVSSPGIERTLYCEDHYNRYIGSMVTVRLEKLHEGSKKFEGELKGFSSAYVEIVKEGVQIDIPREKIASIQLKGEF